LILSECFDVAGRRLTGKGLNYEISAITILKTMRKAISSPALFGLFPA
jgi:hypothetical protein